MNINSIKLVLAAVMTIGLLAGCSQSAASEAQTAAESNSAVTSAETAPQVELSAEGLDPVSGDDLIDGTYSINVDSSSSMFNITSCELTVEGGKMSAVMTMGGKGYLYVFMGKGEDALNADESTYIPFAENEDGSHSFTVPVEALNKVLDCSAFSKKKEQWYDRELIFRADAVPQDAYKEDSFITAESLGLADGSYSIDVALEGGSGRASIASPTRMTVENGTAYAEIVFSSSNYDYMTVNGERYDMINTEGNSTFYIPITMFDKKMPVTADTTAMSTPYEIKYTLYFDSSTIAAE
ncbi:MAG: hypothetical protein ACI4KF_13170 [Huintestinicola sp.]